MAAQAPDSDTQHLATELRTVVTRLVKKLRAHSPTRDKLSLTERSVVRQLDQHPHLLPSELAEMEKVTTQSMSQILRHLAERGYVLRQPSPTDGRKVHIVLSDAGRQLLQTARQERDEWLHAVLTEQCSAAELAALQQVLPVLTKLVASE
ncbi:MAG TPA: MarR family transcriptional regulator [Hymenobacter sp.]|uniref:MarR family winged helix-turn-helix transcriptional regulator n=1 Tax=Hymenobacter sp. TaxID=1898978 RepID=UPI002D7E3816|nr:MarR family transcriptional regulator [Hymenobacter sp.]HET9502736.1 MarR family transcriptional regulator [Hymenobacter sp.]